MACSGPQLRSRKGKALLLPLALVFATSLLALHSQAGAVLRRADTTAFVGPAPRVGLSRTAASLLPLVSVAGAPLFGSAAHAEINVEAYAAAAGVSTDDARSMLMGDRVDPAGQVGSAFVDTIFDTVLPFTIGFGIALPLQ
ncbi:unnamed protein product [Polarella glacialis]|uniref:Uncharacterized protein n=1 Tax=Polarella glacialis TaxID=89957 RepID=A0A813HFR2_POLGL|nr:unnamed protein product [Polarella glacialis]CAE8733520.1 unnamed protein product [Polarella glacialis]